MSATTVNGNPLSFNVGTDVMVNGATVTMADVGTSNGVIHVIDKVLMQQQLQTIFQELLNVLVYTTHWYQESYKQSY